MFLNFITGYGSSKVCVLGRPLWGFPERCHHQVKDHPSGTKFATTDLAAHDYGFGCNASASEETLDGGWLPGGAHGNSDSIEIGKDVLCVSSTPDSFD